MRIDISIVGLLANDQTVGSITLTRVGIFYVNMWPKSVTSVESATPREILSLSANMFYSNVVGRMRLQAITSRWIEKRKKDRKSEKGRSIGGYWICNRGHETIGTLSPISTPSRGASHLPFRNEPLFPRIKRSHRRRLSVQLNVLFARQSKVSNCITRIFIPCTSLFLKNFYIANTTTEENND